MLTIDKIKIGDEIYNITGDGGVSDEKIAEVVNEYMVENPVSMDGYVTESEMNTVISNIQSMSVNYDSANKSIIFN